MTLTYLDNGGPNQRDLRRQWELLHHGAGWLVWHRDTFPGRLHLHAAESSVTRMSLPASPGQNYAVDHGDSHPDLHRRREWSLSGSTRRQSATGRNGTPVTAVPDTGYHFLKWSDNSEANPRTDLNVIADKSVTASFIINSRRTHRFRWRQQDRPGQVHSGHGHGLVGAIQRCSMAQRRPRPGRHQLRAALRLQRRWQGRSRPSSSSQPAPSGTSSSATGNWGSLYVGSDYNTVGFRLGLRRRPQDRPRQVLARRSARSGTTSPRPDHGRAPLSAQMPRRICLPLTMTAMARPTWPSTSRPRAPSGTSSPVPACGTASTSARMARRSPARTLTAMASPTWPSS